MDKTWRICAKQPLPMRCWEGDYVVYNPLSGNTHMLDILAGEVLKTIMAGAIDDGQLCRHIANYLDVPNDSRVAENLAGILSALDDLGLIEPVHGC